MLQTSGAKPFSIVRCSLMKPLNITYFPSTVSRENSSYLLTTGAETNTRSGSSLNQKINRYTNHTISSTPSPTRTGSKQLKCDIDITREHSRENPNRKRGKNLILTFSTRLLRRLNAFLGSRFWL